MMRKMKKWLIIGIAFIFICAFGTALGKSSSNDTDKKDNKSEQVEKNDDKSKETAKKNDKSKKTEEKDDFTLEGKVEANTDDYGFTTLTGKIKNNTKRKATYVQVQFNIYDKDDNQLGSTLANINNLEAGGTWKFKAVTYEKGAAKYKIAKISGW